MMNLVDDIKAFARRLGFSATGICDAEPLEEEGRRLEEWVAQNLHGTMHWMARTRRERADPRSFFPQAQSIIVVAQNYYREDEPILLPPDRGNISLYARGRDYHKVLRKKLRRLLNFIQEKIPGTTGRICVDSFPIMEKALAVKAGLGWIGKHTNLILKGKGSYFFLGEILLSAKLPPDPPFAFDHCGTCDRCQVACPTGALDRAYQIDARRCISYLTIEHRGDIDPRWHAGMGNWVFGCDICQVVCPWNRFSVSTEEPDFASRFSLDDLRLEKLQQLSEEAFRRMFEGTPVRRAGYERFMNSVQIAM
ncbi:MAG: tRNA epoxyqueuosine(34) reductase QueG, partial [Calditrichaeota bacterium]